MATKSSPFTADVTDDVLNAADELMLTYWRHHSGSYAHPFALGARRLARAMVLSAQSNTDLPQNNAPTESQLAQILWQKPLGQSLHTWHIYAPLWLQICATLYHEYVTFNPAGHLHPWADGHRLDTSSSEVVRRAMTILPRELRQAEHAHYVDEKKATRVVGEYMRRGLLASFMGPEDLVRNFIRHSVVGPHTLNFDLGPHNIADLVLHLAVLPGFPRLKARIVDLLYQQPSIYEQCLPEWAQCCLAWYETHKHDFPSTINSLDVFRRAICEAGYPKTAGRESEALRALNIAMSHRCTDNFYRIQSGGLRTGDGDVL